MKTSKLSATASDAAPNRRAQPVRQTRTNPPRSSATTGRGAGRDRDGVSGAAQEQPIDIFPGVTHFADAITALPKELVKHFTLLKEVDAKIHVPQQALFELINTALRQPVPNSTRSPYDGSAATPNAPASATATAQNANADGPSSAPNGRSTQAQPVGTEVAAPSVFDPSNLPRRHLFRQVAIEIREMLVALEEKNHVITTANDALNKQMGRIDDIWPHLELEFSEEAKWGSDTHWAYPENRAASRAMNNAQQAERSRREGAANLSAAAQHLAEEAAARSDARKQAVAARRSQKAAQQAGHQDSDADDLHHKAETRKQGGGAKSRKPAADAAAAAAGAGLGILSGAAGAASAATAAPKRRKAEKTAPTSAPMERALSGVYASATGSAKGRISSPHQSPAPEGGKKRKALPSGGNAAKKSRNTASATSSPVIGAFPDPVRNTRASPAPSNLGIHTSESLSRSASQSGAYNGVAIPTTPSLLPTTELPMKKTSDTGKETLGAKNPGSDDKSAPLPVGGSAITSSANAAAGASGPSVSTAPAAAPGNIAGSSAAVASSNSNAAYGISGFASAPAVASATPTPAMSSLEHNDGGKAVPTVAASGLPVSQAQVVSPSVEDQSEAQLRAENSKQRPSPLAAPAEIKLRNGVGAAPSPTTVAGALSNPRAPIEKPNKVSPVPTPVPAPVSAPSHTPSAIASPAKVQVLKVEATEASSTFSAVPMTRTRSAGGAKKEAGAMGALAPSSSSTAVPATPTSSSGAFNTKPSTESSTPAGRLPSSAASASGAATKKESTPLSSASVLSIQQPSVTTKSGRANKPSTPSLATFAESTTRSRPSRSSEPASLNGNSSSSGGASNGNGSGSGSAGSGSVKRSHKKGASISSNAHAREGGQHRDHHRSHSSVVAGDGHGSAPAAAGGNGNGSGSDVSSGSGRSMQQRQQQQKQKQSQQKQQQQHQQQVDDNDPLYCYCQQVSFGEMIACDADDCEREWFHLECAGLRVAPKSNVKWYCDDCKKRLKVKSNGR